MARCLVYTSRMTEKSANNVEHHQKRVGQERRERTRALLIRSAIDVFARRGPDAPVIDDFIAAAGLARGTFYNYFRTTHELLEAVTGELSDEVLGVVDLEVLKYEDPAVRVCVGTRLYAQFALTYPVWGTFLTRIGSAHAVRGKLLDVYLGRDLALGIAGGRFEVGTALPARDIILGSIFFGIETLLTEASSGQHIERMLQIVLQGMGLSAQEAHTIAYMPLPDVGAMPSSIFSTLKQVAPPAATAS